MKYFLAGTAVLLLTVTSSLLGQKSEDEQTIRSAEEGWVSHMGGTPEDLAFFKRILPEQGGLTIDSVGRIFPFSFSDAEKQFKADFNVKFTGGITNLKINFYGLDTAVATYSTSFVQTGHKDKKFDSNDTLTCLDVWHKMNGQWKFVAGSNTSTKPLGPEAYHSELPPGTPAPLN
jgi:hypothetical protein